MEPIEQKSFVNTAVIIGVIFGVVYSLINVITLTIGVNSGAVGVGSVLFFCFMCCAFAILPGLLANRYYIIEIQSAIEIGKGALIGLTAGIVFGVVFGFFDNVVWKIFGVDTEALTMEYMLLMFENLDLQDANMRDQMMESSSGSRVLSLFLNVLVAGLLNVLSGMAGAAIFSKPFNKEI